MFALVLLAIYIVLTLVAMVFATSRGWWPWTVGEELVPISDVRRPYHRD